LREDCEKEYKICTANMVDETVYRDAWSLSLFGKHWDGKNMFSNFPRKVLEPLLTVICPTILCALVGLVTFGTKTFHPKAPPFQLVATGLIVGILVAAAQRSSLTRFTGFTVLLIIIFIITTGSSSPRLIFHNIVLMVALAGAVLINFKVLVKTPQAYLIGQFVAWSIVFILAYFLAGVVLMVFFRPAEIARYLLIYGVYAVLIGIGLGTGFVAKEWLIRKLYTYKTQSVTEAGQ
jgi:hypothetical protein